MAEVAGSGEPDRVNGRPLQRLPFTLISFVCILLLAAIVLEAASVTRSIQMVLIAAALILCGIAGVLLGRNHRRILDLLLTTEERRRQLEAMNQQLFATEQQLRASNQQLLATEQQLLASNQQLRASEEQLQAANQQLRASEEALRQSEHRSRTLFSDMLEGMALHEVVYDSAGSAVDYRILEVNSRYEQILGIRRSGVIGRLSTEVYGVPDAPYLEEFSRVAETGKPDRFETYFPAMDRHFSISVCSFEKGHFATIFSDITGRKKAEEESRLNEARLSTLLAIHQYRTEDPHQLLDFALEKAIALTGSTIGYIYHYDERTEEFRLNSWSKEVMNECSIVEQQTVYHLAKTGIWGEAVRQRRPIVLNDFAADNPLKRGYPEGHVHLTRFLTIPVMSSDRIVAVAGVANKATNYDYDDIRQFALLMASVWTMVEGMQERTQREHLEVQVQKLESLGVLAGGIAHDFNNLLTSVLANVSFVSLKIRGDERLAARFSEIEKAALRARDLTQQLLTFARGGEPVRKLASLQSIVRDAVALAVSGAPVQCHFGFADDLCPAEIDAGQISQAINNIALNAVQAMPAGGTIRIGARNVTVGPLATVPLDPGAYVSLTIADTGTGISRKHLDRIFDPYFTTKQVGSGLGLAVTNSIVRRHGGHINVESEVGAGTTFRVYLPASCGSVVEQAEDDLHHLRGSGAVLVMDDEEQIRSIAAAILEELGYEVAVASEGREALALYQNRLKAGKTFDAVILDLTVPGGMGGRETMLKLLEIDPRARVIVSSGYCNDPVMADFRKYGFREMVMKPYRVEDLAAAVSRTITSEE